MSAASLNDLELFFEDPATEPYSAGKPAVDPTNSGLSCRKYSTLYHLRRNIQFCFGDGSVGAQVPAPWPGALCIMAGIDLLSLFHAGISNADGSMPAGCSSLDKWKYTNEGRFTQFIKDQFDAPANKRFQQLWKLRNTLMHSFGIQVRGKEKFRLSADRSATTLVKTIRSSPPSIYAVDLCVLQKSFEAAIQKYKCTLDLVDQANSRNDNFHRMFAHYGWMYVFPSPQPPSTTQVQQALLPATVQAGLVVGVQSQITFCANASGM
jgi:hypothetical protein